LLLHVAIVCICRWTIIFRHQTIGDILDYLDRFITIWNTCTDSQIWTEWCEGGIVYC